MLIKKIFTNSKIFQKKVNRSGFTLLETLVATGIAAIVITSAIGVTGNIYRSQRKVQFAQDFYSESRFMMERISQITRNNTLDYDRYFIEVGPEESGSCSAFEENQLPQRFRSGGADALTDYDNSRSNRFILGYETIFYWDTDSDGEQDRNLGGVIPDGSDDPCTKAWEEKALLQELFLINGSRNMRTAIRRNLTSIEEFDSDQDGTPETANPDYDTTDPNFNKLEMQRQLGTDIDGDGKIDVWAPNSSPITVDIDGDGTDETGNVLVHWDDTEKCIIYVEDGTSDFQGTEPFKSILGENTSEDFCNKAHDFTAISPNALEITELTFSLSPSRDPYLNFRVDSAQIHPQVFISMTTEVRNPKLYDFETKENAPHLSFQTMVSSRVFGNSRK